MTRPTEQERFERWEAWVNRQLKLTEQEAAKALRWAEWADRQGKTKYPSTQPENR